jgi:hypothetical protein
MSIWQQNKAQISENQSGFLFNIMFLSSLLRNSSYIECLLYKASDRISSPLRQTGVFFKLYPCKIREYG